MKGGPVGEVDALVARADARAWREVAELIRAVGGYRWVGLYLVTGTEIRAVAWTGPAAPAFPLSSRDDAGLLQRWLSIPPGTWHRPVVDPDEDWFVVSFHTAAADQLVEELATHDTNPDEAATHANLYAGRLAR